MPLYADRGPGKPSCTADAGHANAHETTIASGNFAEQVYLATLFSQHLEVVELALMSSLRYSRLLHVSCNVMVLFGMKRRQTSQHGEDC